LPTINAAVVVVKKPVNWIRSSSRISRLVKRMRLKPSLSAHHALRIADAKCFALFVQEVELGEVTVQMGGRDAVIDACNVALQDREVTLERVRVPEVDTDVWKMCSERSHLARPITFLGQPR
jgi:hypothetical protein